MKIIGFISAKGGLGNTTLLASVASQLQNSLAIDSHLGFRQLDLICSVENKVVYDFYDYVKGVDSEKCIIKKEEFHLLAASQTKSLRDFSQEETLQRLKILPYDFILIDIPKEESYLEFYKDICDEFIILSTDTDLSLRNLDKILFLFFKNRILKPQHLVFTFLEETLQMENSELKNILRPNIQIISQIPKYRVSDNLSEHRDYQRRIQKLVNVLQGAPIEIEEIMKEKKTVFDRLFRKEV
ncbi:MAG: hypothetical protein Q4P25_00645 [Tissierellia bacterium]|nr:hypothetical protein [Tissierellia bacterium]